MLLQIAYNISSGNIGILHSCSAIIIKRIHDSILLSWTHNDVCNAIIYNNDKIAMRCEKKKEMINGNQSKWCKDCKCSNIGCVSQRLRAIPSKCIDNTPITSDSDQPLKATEKKRYNEAIEAMRTIKNWNKFCFKCIVKEISRKSGIGNLSTARTANTARKPPISSRNGKNNDNNNFRLRSFATIANNERISSRINIRSNSNVSNENGKKITAVAGNDSGTLNTIVEEKRINNNKDNNNKVTSVSDISNTSNEENQLNFTTLVGLNDSLIIQTPEKPKNEPNNEISEEKMETFQNNDGTNDKTENGDIQRITLRNRNKLNKRYNNLNESNIGISEFMTNNNNNKNENKLDKEGKASGQINHSNENLGNSLNFGNISSIENNGINDITFSLSILEIQINENEKENEKEKNKLDKADSIFIFEPLQMDLNEKENEKEKNTIQINGLHATQVVQGCEREQSPQQIISRKNEYKELSKANEILMKEKLQLSNQIAKDAKEIQDMKSTIEQSQRLNNVLQNNIAKIKKQKHESEEKWQKKEENATKTINEMIIEQEKQQKEIKKLNMEKSDLLQRIKFTSSTWIY